MDRPSDESNPTSIPEQLRRVLKDAADYALSLLTLWHARAIEMSLSAMTVGVLLFVGALALGGALVLLAVALGVWLAHLTGSVLGSLLILGGVLFVVAAIAVGIAIRWLKNLKS